MLKFSPSVWTPTDRLIPVKQHFSLGNFCGNSGTQSPTRDTQTIGTLLYKFIWIFTKTRLYPSIKIKYTDR